MQWVETMHLKLLLKVQLTLRQDILILTLYFLVIPLLSTSPPIALDGKDAGGTTFGDNSSHYCVGAGSIPGKGYEMGHCIIKFINGDTAITYYEIKFFRPKI